MIQQQQTNLIQNQNLNLIQQQNANINRIPNFSMNQEQNNIQSQLNINNKNNSENLRQNNGNPINPQNENRIQNQNNISSNPQYNNISQQQNPQIIYNQNHNFQNPNLNMEKINNREPIKSNDNQITNNAYKQNIPQNQENIDMGQMQQIPDNTIIGNIIIKNGKAYYLNPLQNDNNNNSHPQSLINLQNQIQSQNIINNKGVIEGNINNNQQINYQNQLPINNNPNLSQNGNPINIPQKPQYLPQQPQQTNNSGQILKSGKRVINKKTKTSRVSKLLKIKDSNDHRPALQYKVERNRPVYAVPPSKKRSVSQGKPFNLIHKYYDENYILEDDEEDSLKLEESINLQIAKNISDNEDNNNDNDNNNDK